MDAPPQGSARRITLFISAHIFVWTLLPLLTHIDYSFDVLEGITWGRHLQWGYPKHPPLAFWVLGLIPRLPGWPVWLAYLFSQISIAATFLLVWRFARRVMDEQRAFLSVLILQCIAFYNGLGTAFNPNVLQLPLWAAIVYLFWRATTTDRWRAWIALGIAAGLGLLTKYYTGMLLLPLGLLLLLTRDGRTQLRKPGPWTSLLITSAIFAPHLWWLQKNDWQPFRYAMERAASQVSWTHRHFLYALDFTGTQLLILLPAIVCLLVLGAKTAKNAKPEQRLLWVAAFSPFIVTIAASVLFGWKLIDAWGTPLWTFLPMWWLNHSANEFSPAALRRFGVMWGIIVFALMVLFGLEHRLDHRKHLPATAIAQIVTMTWHQRTNTPLRFVIGDTSAAATVSVFSPDHPEAYIYADPRKSPGVSYAAVQNAGGMMVWQGTGDPQKIPYDMGGWFPNAELLQTVSLPTDNGQQFVLEWAYVAPRKPH